MGYQGADSSGRLALGAGASGSWPARMLLVVAVVVGLTLPLKARAQDKEAFSAAEALRRGQDAFAKDGFSDEAVGWFLAAAKKKSPEGAWQMARYHDARQTDELLGGDAKAFGLDHKQYKLWLRAAAALGQPEAVKTLAQLVAKDKRWAQEEGQGPKPGKAKAAKKAKTAKPAPKTEEELAREKEAARIEELRKKAEAGDAEAQSSMGDYYANLNSKELQTREDDLEAMRWYEKAALQGDSPSMYVLGDFFYLEGRTVDKDMDQALYWLKKSAALNNPQAEMVLGYLYEQGKDVEKDWAKARYWYQRAVDHQWPMAKFGLERVGGADGAGLRRAEVDSDEDLAKVETGKGDYYADPNGGHFDAELAKQWYASAAKRGSVEAMAKLGDVFDSDCGGVLNDPSEDEPNCKQALYWYTQAAVNGNAHGSEQVKKYHEAGWR